MKEEGLTISGTNITVHEDVDKMRENLENLLTVMHRAPHKSKIKTNPFANNASYLHISNMEMDLDRLYLGLWEFLPHGQGVQVLINSVVFTGVLRVFNPVANTWISRAGVGAVDIQIVPALDKQDRLNENAGQPQAKAIQKAVGAAKAIAFKNAAKSLGKRFGRDINRKAGEEEVNYERWYSRKSVVDEQNTQDKSE